MGSDFNDEPFHQQNCWVEPSLAGTANPRSPRGAKCGNTDSAWIGGAGDPLGALRSIDGQIRRRGHPGYRPAVAWWHRRPPRDARASPHPPYSGDRRHWTTGDRRRPWSGLRVAKACVSRAPNRDSTHLYSVGRHDFRQRVAAFAALGVAPRRSPGQSSPQTTFDSAVRSVL
jgi:hypothetical protein